MNGEKEVYNKRRQQHDSLKKKIPSEKTDVPCGIDPCSVLVSANPIKSVGMLCNLNTSIRISLASRHSWYVRGCADARISAARMLASTARRREREIFSNIPQYQTTLTLTHHWGLEPWHLKVFTRARDVQTGLPAGAAAHCSLPPLHI